jgi:hypothetical protein
MSANPTLQLWISRDGGNTWVSAGSAQQGAQGQYLARAIWRRLGRTRADRLCIRVTQSANLKTVWSGMWGRLTAGTGEL